jgi:hypothetical protein
LNWNNLVRQTHRWLSIAFTVSVIVTFIALARQNPVIWVSYVPLFPLALLCGHRSVLVRAAVCHQVAPGATHRRARHSRGVNRMIGETSTKAACTN